jgi:TPR repeat protein
MGRAYAEGTGVPRDDNLGVMWIAKAAAGGHLISQAQISGMIRAVTASTTASS